MFESQVVSCHGEEAYFAPAWVIETTMEITSVHPERVIETNDNLSINEMLE